MKRKTRTWDVPSWVQLLRDSNKKHVVLTEDTSSIVKFAQRFRLTKDSILEFVKSADVADALTGGSMDYLVENNDGYMTVQEVRSDHVLVKTNKAKREVKITLEKVAEFVPLENLDDQNRALIYRMLVNIYNSFGVIQLPMKEHTGTDMKFCFPMKYTFWSEMTDFCKVLKTRGGMIRFDISATPAYDISSQLMLTIEIPLAS